MMYGKDMEKDIKRLGIVPDIVYEYFKTMTFLIDPEKPGYSVYYRTRKNGVLLGVPKKYKDGLANYIRSLIISVEKKSGMKANSAGSGSRVINLDNEGKIRYHLFSTITVK